jgi:hypothetical protein
VAGTSDVGQWLQEQQQFVPHGLLLETLQDLQQKYLYRTDQEAGASALEQAVGSLFGNTIALGNA